MVLDQEKFNSLLDRYVTAEVKANQWDAMAPVGMTKKQQAKEAKIHTTRDEAYNELWYYVSGG